MKVQGTIILSMAIAATLGLASCSSAPGSTGPAGPAGPAGANGAAGVAGAAGATGPAGAAGATGAAGPAGVAGPAGAAGATGATGPAGPPGTTGPAGPAGVSGTSDMYIARYSGGWATPVNSFSWSGATQVLHLDVPAGSYLFNFGGEAYNGGGYCQLTGGDRSEGQEFTFFNPGQAQGGFSRSGVVDVATAGTLRITCGGDGQVAVNNLYLNALRVSTPTVSYNAN